MNKNEIHNKWLENMNSWHSEKTNELFKKINLLEEQKNIIYPPNDVRLRVYKKDPSFFKVVILGQDPYHGNGQANGMSFSVNNNIKAPPSLKNIFTELNSDFNVNKERSVDLTTWFEQGVMLLNSILTVNAGIPASHKGKGWEEITDETIKYLSQTNKNMVFILWGKFAQDKAQFIEGDHLIIKSPHPSPYSANTGFFGSKPFTKCNEYLLKTNQKKIDWFL